MANSISINDIINTMQTQTELDTKREVKKEMGKSDFLMLLSAQLRYQDPLEPIKDSDFVAQLAQFSTLEQMENMNRAIEAMATYQSYSLIGKLVMANAHIDGVLTQVFGTVDCIFTNKGVTYAQIGEYTVPIATISEVYDNSALLTPKMLIETSNILIGRSVVAEYDGKTIAGVVTRVIVDDGEMYAFIDDGSEEEAMVPVGSIYSITGRNDAAGQVSYQTLMETSNNLIGRTVVAKIKVDDDEYEDVEGVVKRVAIDDGALYAFLDDGSGELRKVPVESIFDIRLTEVSSEAKKTDEEEQRIKAQLEAALIDAQTSYLGQKVNVQIGGETIAAVVNSIEIYDGAIYAVVTDEFGELRTVALGSILGVWTPNAPGNVNNDTPDEELDAAKDAFIGADVTAQIDGFTVEGQVVDVLRIGDDLYAVMRDENGDEHELPLGSVEIKPPEAP